MDLISDFMQPHLIQLSIPTTQSFSNPAEKNARYPLFKELNTRMPITCMLYEWQFNNYDTTGLYYYFEVLNGSYDIFLYFSENEYLNEGERISDVEM